MRGQNRKVYPDIINHSYQRTINGNLLFYNDLDHLSFFTIFCVTKEKYPGIRVFKLCQMPDHLHSSCAASSRAELSAFTQNYTSVFAREHNEVCHEKGNVFRSPFGSVPKYGDKKARSTFIYVDNNPVERRLVEKAEDYRWNYLAYGASENPFSEPLRFEDASVSLRKAALIVRKMHGQNKYLSYPLLVKLFRPLNDKEISQLSDYIVVTYNVLDYGGAERFFGSRKNMLEAVHSVTGNEYDLNEVFTGWSDECYQKMTDYLMKTGNYKDIHDIFRIPVEKRLGIMNELLSHIDALPEQAAKYLHIPWRKNCDEMR